VTTGLRANHKIGNLRERKAADGYRYPDQKRCGVEIGPVANEPQLRKVMDTAHFTLAQAAYCSGTHVAE
jgi:hypothetical protein